MVIKKSPFAEQKREAANEKRTNAGEDEDYGDSAGVMEEGELVKGYTLVLA